MLLPQGGCVTLIRREGFVIRPQPAVTVILQQRGGSVNLGHRYGIVLQAAIKKYARLLRFPSARFPAKNVMQMGIALGGVIGLGKAILTLMLQHAR